MHVISRLEWKGSLFSLWFAIPLSLFVESTMSFTQRAERKPLQQWTTPKPKTGELKNSEKKKQQNWQDRIGTEMISDLLLLSTCRKTESLADIINGWTEIESLSLFH